MSSRSMIHTIIIRPLIYVFFIAAVSTLLYEENGKRLCYQRIDMFRTHMHASGISIYYFAVNTTLTEKPAAAQPSLRPGKCVQPLQHITHRIYTVYTPPYETLLRVYCDLHTYCTPHEVLLLQY